MYNLQRTPPFQSCWCWMTLIWGTLSFFFFKVRVLGKWSKKRSWVQSSCGKSPGKVLNLKNDVARPEALTCRPRRGLLLPHLQTDWINQYFHIVWTEEISLNSYTVFNVWGFQDTSVFKKKIRESRNQEPQRFYQLSELPILCRQMRSRWISRKNILRHAALWVHWRDFKKCGSHHLQKVVPKRSKKKSLINYLLQLLVFFYVK